MASGNPSAQSRTTQAKGRVDAEYTAKIKEYLQDSRITSELVDHLPASDTVPTPLKFLGRIVGTPGELTYAKDIYRYYDALDKASDRISVWRIGRLKRDGTWCSWLLPTRALSSRSTGSKECWRL